MRNLLLSLALVAVAGCVTQPAAPVVAETAAPAPVAYPAPPPAVVAVAPAPAPPPAVPIVLPDFASLLLPSIPLPPGRLTLSNFRFGLVDVEALVTTYPDCELHPGLVPMDLKLPLNGTWVIEATPGADVCWRRQLPPGPPTPGAPHWTPWNRDYTGQGRSIDTQL